MQKSLSPLQYFILAVTAFLLVIFHLYAGWSQSVDLAHHYALTARLAENFQLPGGDPTLGEMNYYPHGSHALAAILGTLLNSTLLGMQIVALGSLALVWAAYVAMLYTLPGRASTIGMLVLAGLVFLNHEFLGIPLHGAEISGNYFFAQLAGQALAAVAVVIAIHLEPKHPRWHIYAFLIVAASLLCSVHLLPALELLALLALLLVIDTADAAKASGWSWREAGASAVVLVVAVAGVVGNPAFGAMRQIAENDGRLILPFLPNAGAIFILCLVALAVSALLLSSWWRSGRSSAATKYLALYGAGMAGLCILQLMLLRFHLGSDYAVKKYAFGIASFVLVCLARAIAAPVADVVNTVLRGHRVPGEFIVPTLAIVLTLSVCFCYATPWRNVLDTATVVKLERQILAMRDVTLPLAPPGKHDVVIDLAGQSSVVHYMFSIALAHTPREVAGLALVDHNKLGNMDQYGSIISSRGVSRYMGRGCERPSSGPLVAYDPVCLQKSLAVSILCKGTVDFSVKGQLDPNLLTGFSAAEPESRWTQSPEATYSCTAAGATRARLLVTPFLQGSQTSQRLLVTVNGGKPVETHFLVPATSTTIDIPLPAVPAGTVMEFKLSMPDAKSPKELGIGDDGRSLGVSVRTLVFE